MTDLETRLRNAGEEHRLDRPISDVISRGEALRRRRNTFMYSAVCAGVVAAALLAPTIATLGGDQLAHPADTPSPSLVPPSGVRQPESTDEQMSPEQLAAIADGVVTRQEYRASFDRLTACVTARGGELSQVDTTRRVISYSFMDSYLAAHDHCYAREFKRIDIQWQLAQAEARE